MHAFYELLSVNNFKKICKDMTSQEIRQTFIDFFVSKGHTAVPSSPIVNKNDPGLLFTNAGMNQFKDIFLGNKPIVHPRATDSQKCLRVSGKHNDLEEVGRDTYHHTMFEMLGNWSFGDYFKKEAIAYAWELLTKVYKIDSERLYVTVFGGDKTENLNMDNEAKEYWLQWVPEDKIILGNKKDNFWEMGDQGPCGPCSEIHIDLREDEQERKRVSGRDLVNHDDPLVIEIWNLVFIQYNRKADGSLELLAHKHIDTGMGFERLCRVIQHVNSNYDTDVFQPLIQYIAKESGIAYGQDEKSDIAMRVVADHVRAITFAISDGQLPSNTGAGYVIRRILRRAVRYSYTFLNIKRPFLYELMDVLVDQMSQIYPEVEKQHSMCKRIIAEEEQAFLKTLETGIQRFNQYIDSHKDQSTIDGDFAFELFDTYGFPIDLTTLMANEIGKKVDMNGFNDNLQQQKNRSKKASEQSLSDWVFVSYSEEEARKINYSFCGYDRCECDVNIVKYRKILMKDKTFYQLVFSCTPFYAEMGGEVGDTGVITNENETIKIINTKKENDLSIHITTELPKHPEAKFIAKVNIERKKAIAANHSATHLLQNALRHVLGNHIEQKGSFVCPDYLRFDFSHYQKMSDEEIRRTEDIVNNYIRDDYRRDEKRDMDIDEAKRLGAMALFGEKYGKKVRVIRFGESMELCGGIHVDATGNIGLFKIVSESAVAAGIRRIEAYTGARAFEYLESQLYIVNEIKSALKVQDCMKGIAALISQNAELKKEVEQYKLEKVNVIKTGLMSNIKEVNGINIISGVVDVETGDLKNMAFDLKQGHTNTAIVLGTKKNNKAAICIVFSDDLVETGKYNAGNVIKVAVKEINGGGGGQAYFATAGGKSPENIDKAVNKAVELIIS